MRGEILPLKTIRQAAFSNRFSESKAISVYVYAFCSTKIRVAARRPAAETVVVFIPYKIRRSFQPRYETEILSLGPNMVITAAFSKFYLFFDAHQPRGDYAGVAVRLHSFDLFGVPFVQVFIFTNRYRARKIWGIDDFGEASSNRISHKYDM